MQLTFTTLAGLLLGSCKEPSLFKYIIAGLIGLPCLQMEEVWLRTSATFGYILGFGRCLCCGIDCGQRKEVSYSRYLLASFELQPAISRYHLFSYNYESVPWKQYVYENSNALRNPFIPGDVIMVSCFLGCEENQIPLTLVKHSRTKMM